MTSKARGGVTEGKELKFRVDRKIVTAEDGGEWGNPREIMASLEPFGDEPGFHTSRVRLSDDQTSLWITLPPKLTVEEGPNTRVVDVVVTGKFKVAGDDRGSVVTQLLRFIRHQQSRDTFLRHTNLALRINIPDYYMDDEVPEEDANQVWALDHEDDDETESDDEKGISALRRKRKAAEDSDGDIEDDVEDMTERIKAERNAERKAERNAERKRATAEQQRSVESRYDGRPRRNRRRTEELPAALNERVYVKESDINNAGNGLFARVDFNEGDTVAWMGEASLIDLDMQKELEAEGFPHDAFIHNEKTSGPLRHDRKNTLFMDLDFNDKNNRPLWYFINHGVSEANLIVEYDPNDQRFKWIAKRFIPSGEELLFNYSPGEKITFEN
jgi:hypothetical protein